MHISLNKRDFSSNDAGFNLSTTGITSICIIVVLFISVTGCLCLLNTPRKRQERLDRLRRSQHAVRTADNRPTRDRLRSHRPSGWDAQRLSNTQIKFPAQAYVVGKAVEPFEPPPAYQA
ncbi:uncharacterized protein PV07_12173 [Cladophialophora immunda]|uniref:Uncharacterized protein n=1 Tax=Cladophialophora immunda TaxID=569365 RepID=A0A0D2BV15_9EURO|nr:uncharacterized protein PV07_12173 [Cladophialophora immunda]KIW22270.1 hypothetical protein PV07_12173 [Cladophialophora immunda]